MIISLKKVARYLNIVINIKYESITYQMDIHEHQERESIRESESKYAQKNT